MKKTQALFASIVVIFPVLVFASPTPQDLNDNGIQDSSEAEVVLVSSTSLPAGEYNFNNLIVPAGVTLTIESDQLSSTNFKGVKINAQNINIQSGGKISANEQGYFGTYSPGTDINSLAGASYGGEGGNFGIPKPIYGSATHPTDLGSGGPYVGRGGGAIQVSVSQVFMNNGIVSANGGPSSSGGSILVNTNSFQGSGKFEANGGGLSSSSVYMGPGGGGRVAIYYSSSNFTGVVDAKGGCGSLGQGYPNSCGENGTAGLFDMPNNNFYSGSSWRFEKNDSPFNFNIIQLNGSQVKSQNDVKIKAINTLVSNTAFILGGNVSFISTDLNISNNSGVTLGTAGTTTVDNLNIQSGSYLDTVGLNKIYLNLKSLNIDSTSKIVSDYIGYGQNSGPGSTSNALNGFAGASYGGVGYGNTSESVYGSETAPTDFGSGGNAPYSVGGGVVMLNISGDSIIDGVISAKGRDASSGGSIFLTTKNLSGSGSFVAKGGTAYCPNSCYFPGGGGRIAVYYDQTNFSGSMDASGGGCSSCYYGKGGDGTVVYEKNVLLEQTGTSVVFFPGVMGSRLYDNMMGTEIEDWASTVDANHAKLALDSNGKSVNNLYTKDDTQSISDEAETGITDEIYGQNIYNSFINDLRNWKLEGAVKDYAFIPYDWRLSLDDIITKGATTTNGKLTYNNNQNFSESYILKKLRELGNNSAHITLIGHSNGGLVIKALVQKLKDTNDPLYYKIDKIIFVAVPQVGTPDAVVNLLHGSSLGFGAVMYNQRSRGLSENMPTVYNILPSSGYFGLVNSSDVYSKIATFVNDPLYQNDTSIYGSDISTKSEMKSYVLGGDGRTKPDYNDTDKPNVGNSSLYTQSEAVHSILDNWQPASTTKVIQIAGWGEETTSGIEYKTCKDYHILSTVHKCLSIRKVVDGDGTVVVPSALWMSTSTPNVERWWVDLASYNKGSPSVLHTVHKDILEIPYVEDLIRKKLINLSYVDQTNTVVNNSSTLVTIGSRLHYTLHSPLSLGILDNQGRYTGLDPITKQIRQEIPDVNYEQIGDTQFLSIPVDLVGKIKLSGLDVGVFALDVEKQIGNSIIEQVSFQGIPTGTTTQATMNINPAVASSTLQVDINGDGVMDKFLKIDNQSIVTYDDVPPEISISFSTSTIDAVYKGVDQNSTTITATTSFVTSSDSQGNTTTLYFKKEKESSEVKLILTKIVRNGKMVNLPNIEIKLEVNKNKLGTITELKSTVVSSGKEILNLKYSLEKKNTTIRETTNGVFTVVTKQGLVIETIVTDVSGVKFIY